MTDAETESADADTEQSEDDEFTYYPQTTQHPHTIIEGDVVDIVTGADIDADVEDTGSSFGVVFENPEVPSGTVWRNRNIPDGFASSSEYNDALRVAIEGTDINYVRGQEVTEDMVDEARERLADHIETDDFTDEDYDEHRVKGTDLKVADPTDTETEVQSVEFDGEEKVTGIDVGGGQFASEEVDAIESDRIMVWYGGMAGQFVGRGLDFNGMPFARYTEDGYLVKGLFQVPIGWRGDTDVEDYGEVPTTDRSKLATDLGRPPRVARPPVLRDDIDGEVAVEIGRYNGGRMHEVHVLRGMDDYDAYLDGDVEGDEIDMKYDQSPEDTLSAAFDNPNEVYALYHGEGWQDEPANAQSVTDDSGDGGGSFDVAVDADEGDVDHPTEGEVEFAQMVSEKIAGTGVSPDEDIFPVDGGKTDLDGLVAANSGQFDVTPDVDAIREVVYENTDHLGDA